MPRFPALGRLGLAAAFALFAASASATVKVEAQPVFGADMPISEGWTECTVRIENPDGKPVRGRVELASTMSYRDDQAFVSRAPFAVGPGNTAVVMLPTHGFGGGGSITLSVIDDAGTVLEKTNLTVAPRSGPYLVDVEPVSKIGSVLRGASIGVSYENGASSWSGTYALGVGQPKYDATTGDPLLPDRAAGWSAATLAVIRSEQLVKLPAVALDALAGWVLAGGSLAVVVARPEDLRSTTLGALAGGEPIAAPPEVALLFGPLPSQSAGKTGPAPTPLTPPFDEDDPFDPTVPPLAPTPTPSPTAPRPVKPAARPALAVAEHLAGYTGGNLHATAYGAAATYGLGEVHLLAFDPTKQPDIDDAWVQSRVVDLVRHAWDRRASLVFPHGAASGVGEAALFPVQAQLDPNESARWTVIFAAVLLLAYAVIAGPVSFSLAAKRGKPLLALRRLPLYAAGMFFVIVGMGFFARGVRGRSRHLTLLEAGAGMPRATARRWRGFFTSEGRQLTVRTTDPSSVLDVNAERHDAGHSLVVDRDGARLVDLAALPWQTVVVREDGFATIGAGVSLVTTADGDLAVVNRIGRDLRSVMVSVPGTTAQLKYFARIKDGESVRASAGKPLGARLPTTTAGKMTVRRFDPAPASRTLDADAAGVAEAWKAIGSAAGTFVDWVPSDVPMVLAQIEGGEGTTVDSSLRLERDRVLVRVVGYGGLP